VDFVAVIETLVKVIESMGVTIIVLGIAWSLIRFAMAWRRHSAPPAYKDLRRSLGRVTLIGLDLLVAADIVLTVATPNSLESLGTLALLVGIRSFLSIEIDMEIEGRWPWQNRAPAKAQALAGQPEQPDA
jgi:uncharacterized membrane protein